jgi:hypothetical protein
MFSHAHGDCRFERFDLPGNLFEEPGFEVPYEFDRTGQGFDLTCQDRGKRAVCAREGTVG